MSQHFDLDPNEKDFFDDFLKEEGIPVHEGYSVEKLGQLEVAPWKRMGGLGAYVRLIGAATVNAGYLNHIPPGESLKPQGEITDNLVLVLDGRGATDLWYSGEEKKKYRINWGQYSLVKVPPGVRYQHHNLDKGRPAKLFTATSLPFFLNLLGTKDLIFGNNYVSEFWQKELGKDMFAPDKGNLTSNTKPVVWHGYVISNVKSFSALDITTKRGVENRSVHFDMGPGLNAHISEFAVGKYKKAHRHGPGAHVIVLSGEGYSLIWREEKKKMKIDWKEGSLFIPPSRWYHQHFNTGTTPARYLAIHSPVEHMLHAETFEDRARDQIEYYQEDPSVMPTYEAELAKKRIASRMTPDLYSKAS